MMPPPFSKASDEENIASYIEYARQGNATASSLAALLPENLSFYQSRGENQINRIRGYILSSFETLGLPDKALPFVLEALDSSWNAYMVGAAAMALRGLKEPMPQLTPYLLKAIENIRYKDDYVTYDMYKPSWPLLNKTTALTEIYKTFQWMGAYGKASLESLEQLLQSKENGANDDRNDALRSAIEAIKNDDRKIETDCCTMEVGKYRFDESIRTIDADIGLLELEDHDGNQVVVNDFFKAKVTVTAFFYTRCANRNKCALTISKLGALQDQLVVQGLSDDVRIAAITYDPGYDTPQRLKAYTENRQMRLNENVKAFRCEPDNMPSLQNYFKLGVNYAGSIVNVHQVELYILDKNGKPVVSFERLEWDNEEVIEEIKALLARPIEKEEPVVKSKKTWLSSATNMIVPFFILFFPKCPICWAAYLSLFGVSWMNELPYLPWLLPVFVGMLALNLFVLWRGAKTRNGYIPFYMSLAGIGLLLVFGQLLIWKPGSYFGLGLILAGTLLNSLPFKSYIKWRLRLGLNTG